MLVDYDNGDEIVPLDGTARDGARFWVYDSLLSEFAALGFEYGYSVENKNALVVWEAQFGDFMNGAQVVIDNFVVAAEDKWDQTSGLVLFLPHGYEGQGPEHSSARIERFLTLAAGDNIQVCNATTAAQFFHLLRRQMHPRAAQAARRVHPEVAAAGPAAAARRSRTSPHGSFEEVLDDPGVADPVSVRRVVLASGKVAVEALHERDERGTPVAVARVEQLYPWPFDGIAVRCSTATPTPTRSCGCRRSPRTWAPGTTSRATSTTATTAPTASGG